MRILHVVPSLGVGGTEKTVLALCRGLDRARFENVVIALKSGGRTLEELRGLSIPVISLDSPNGFWRGSLDSVRLLAGLKTKIEQYPPEIVHTWLSRANVLGRLAAKAVNHRRVISSLRVMEAEKRYHIWAESLTHRFADRFTVNCTALRDFALRVIGVPSDKLVLIPNGIGPMDESSDPKRTALLRAQWVQAEEMAIGTMGRLHRQKGIDIFLTAAAKVVQQFSRARFLIAGEGPERARLIALARKLNLESKVTFCGLVYPGADFLSILDLFVLCSRWEGMPNVILEAMRAKRAIIATAVGGTVDLITHGREGLLVPAEAPDDLARTILELLTHSGLRQRLAEKAQETVSTQFSLERMIQAHASLYESSA